jgi:hypothetical protein
MSLLHLPAFRFGSLLTDLSQMPFLDKRLIHDLFVKMRKCLDLAVEEGLNGLHICCASFHGIPDILQHLSNSGLGILELIFYGLAVEVGEIRYRTDGG